MRLVCSLLCSLLLSACGDDGAGPAPGDAGAEGGIEDAGGEPDAFVPDAPPSECLAGQHPCGAACVDDLPDEPLNGCRLGCGDPCPEPEGGHATCTLSGECDFVCDAPFVRDGEECRCEPATCATLGAACGDVDDGCGGTLSCGGCSGGATCTDGACACADDPGEPNDHMSRPTDLGMLTDSPDSSTTATEYALGSETDEDWLGIAVTDGTDFGNPQITVTLSDIPAGSDYDLEIFYRCTGNASVCTMGTPITLMDGCASRSSGPATETAALSSECSGTDDSGLLLIHVVSTTWSGSCDPYTLRVDVN